MFLIDPYKMSITAQQYRYAQNKTFLPKNESPQATVRPTITNNSQLHYIELHCTINIIIIIIIVFVVCPLYIKILIWGLQVYKLKENTK